MIDQSKTLVFFFFLSCFAKPRYKEENALPASAPGQGQQAWRGLPGLRGLCPLCLTGPKPGQSLGVTFPFHRMPGFSPGFIRANPESLEGRAWRGGNTDAALTLLL